MGYRDCKILDCTLRDGGYYTNWDFENELVIEYFKAMEILPIDYVELGYRSPSMKQYFGKYFYCPQSVLQNAKELMPSKKLAILLNERDIEIEYLKPLLGPTRDYIHMIRVAVDPQNIERAKVLAMEIKAMGFEVAFNVMYMSRWVNDIGFLDKLIGVEEFIDALYMVDSFGGVYPEDIKKLISEITKRTTAPLGFHGHNNIELALINTITAKQLGCLYLDSTITGMGRGAGNLKTELFLTYLNSKENLHINFFTLSSITQRFEQLQYYYRWCTSLPYMFSGANSLAQKNVMNWLSKDRYSFGEIIHSMRPKEEKNSYKPFSDFNVSGKNLIIVGGGNSILKHQDAITNLLLINHDAILIHAGTKYFGTFSESEVSKVCCLVGKEGHRLMLRLSKENRSGLTCVIPSTNQVKSSYIPEELIECTFELPDTDIVQKFYDSPLAISLSLANELKPEKIFMIGFDGYEGRNLTRVEVELASENQEILDKIPSQLKSKIVSLTPTKYKNVNVESIYSHLCQLENQK